MLINITTEDYYADCRIPIRTQKLMQLLNMIPIVEVLTNKFSFTLVCMTNNLMTKNQQSTTIPKSANLKLYNWQKKQIRCNPKRCVAYCALRRSSNYFKKNEVLTHVANSTMGVIQTLITHLHVKLLTRRSNNQTNSILTLKLKLKTCPISVNLT